jgi:hypothetical protein
MTAIREPIAVALLDTIARAYQWNSKPSRRIKLWSDIAKTQRPAAFLQEMEETRVSQSLTLTKRTLGFRLFVYTNSEPVNDELPGSTELNNIIDAIDAAFEPTAAEKMSGRKTLGGLPIQHCQINGQILIDAGDLDGDGIAIIPIRVLLP